MRCVQPGDPDYEADRRIANARFNYRPRYICYCDTPGDVPLALQKAKTEKLAIRIRSGGHHHEGMCSGDGVLMIDLSKLNTITLSGDRRSARIGVGAKLGDVYAALLASNRILPGGGCGDVRVGGLVQGGGWGLYARALGLTCDNVLGFRIFLASGEVRDVGADGAAPGTLFWAVCGGGGGNFGVVTEFEIKLAEVPSPFWQFTLTWDHAAWRQPVIEDWRANFPDADAGLTTFCRVSAVRSDDPPIIVAGNYLGDEARLVETLARLLPRTFLGCTQEISPVLAAAPEAAEASEATQPSDATTPLTPAARRAFHHPQYQPGPPRLAAGGMAAAVEGPPAQTCDGGYYPHKVSSCFPRSTFSAEGTRVITEFLDGQPAEPAARRYLSLHGLGGAVGNPQASRRSCYAFRDKAFMLQYQAWWGDPADKALEQRCLDWVRGFRLTLEHGGFTEGSFINFPDRDLPLVAYYGADNLKSLMQVKRQYDPGNLFGFPMGIPTQ
ncbi:MAG TPA: FAD-binding oxidoreductase [Actinomycetota bacterium]|nr:FAD-binding oxidoreductase [Actinomycetota bacterium]